ncbi:MAG: YafY family transcriptional regulator [Alphaproteobacteria bacterium]|nr:MAG: YafY family transcriptional regulator [Alphaproteobacteria bacterium]
MRRADRLYNIVTYLRSRRMVVTAQDLADEYEVSVRTIYRDIQDLIVSGVPISGEAGVGYMLDKSYYLPPMNFDVSELEALMLGAAMVSSWTDDDMARAARNLVTKIKNVLSDRDRELFAGTALFSPPSRFRPAEVVQFSLVRTAIRQKQKLFIRYGDESGAYSERTVRPLALALFAPAWVMPSWCELRNDFRSFRLDRMKDAAPTGETFVDTEETALSTFLARIRMHDGVKD